MHAIKRTFDFIGDTISYTARNGVTIQIQWIREGVYRVEVLTSGPVAQPIGDLCGSYADEQIARLVARGYALMFDAEADGTDAAETLRVDITDELAKAMRRRDSRRVATLNRLADRLDTPADRALTADIAAHLDQIGDGEKPAPGPARSWREIRDRHAGAVRRDRSAA